MERVQGSVLELGLWLLFLFRIGPTKSKKAQLEPWINKGRKLVLRARLLKCYSQILCGCVPKFLDFGYFVLIWWQTDKNQEILKHCCKNLIIWTNLPIAWLIIGSDNIFNMEVNNGALAILMIVHNSLSQNWNRLKFWILDSYMDISTYWWHTKMILKSGNRPFKFRIFVVEL